MVNDKGFSDMKDKTENYVHDCPEIQSNDMLRVSYLEKSDNVYIQQPGRISKSIQATYCPFCGRHAEEIALEFVDDQDLEVPQDGS